MSTKSVVSNAATSTRDAVADVLDVVRDRDVTFMAAGVSHYALVSLLPLAILALAAASIVGGQMFVVGLVDKLGPVLSESQATVVRQTLSSAGGQTQVGALSLVVLVWSGLKVFRGLDVAFTEIYDERASPSLLEQIRSGLVVLLLVALAIAAMVLTSVFVAVVPLPFDDPALVSYALLFLTLVALFLPLYYVLPPRQMTVGDAVPGAVFAAAGWLVLQLGFYYYARTAGNYDTYGVLGGVLLFVTWLYFGSIVVLVGAVVNAVLGRSGL